MQLRTDTHKYEKLFQFKFLSSLSNITICLYFINYKNCLLKGGKCAPKTGFLAFVQPVWVFRRKNFKAVFGTTLFPIEKVIFIFVIWRLFPSKMVMPSEIIFHCYFGKYCSSIKMLNKKYSTPLLSLPDASFSSKQSTSKRAILFCYLFSIAIFSIYLSCIDNIDIDIDILTSLFVSIRQKIFVNVLKWFCKCPKLKCLI